MKKQYFFFTSLMLTAFCLVIFSCNSTGVSPTYYSRIQIVNTVAGSLPLDCTLNSTRINTTTLAFPNTTGYISATPGNKYVAIAPSATPTVLLDSATVVLKQDSSYSLFFTGQSGAYQSIFIQDDLSAPATGRAKVRFVNASLNPANNLDITINAVAGFTNIPYLGVGKFVEVPAGTYEFRAFLNGTTNNLTTISNQVLADGKVYTLYARGIISNTTATSAFGLTLISNLLPNTK